MHLPDGMVPLRWCVLCYALAGSVVALGIYKMPRERIVPAGLLAGLSFASMQVPVLHAHVNLTGLIGVLMGPLASAPVVFLVNLACGLVGHGGITLVGLNTLLNWLECAGVWALYRILRGAIGVRLAAGIATFAVLSITAFLAALVVAWAVGRAPYYFLITLTPSWILAAGIEATITASAVVALERMTPEWVR
ncbi:MAG: energy-coupling factor ABC transporter permease [Euryarchaeota archaeon]